MDTQGIYTLLLGVSRIPRHPSFSLSADFSLVTMAGYKRRMSTAPPTKRSFKRQRTAPKARARGTLIRVEKKFFDASDSISVPSAGDVKASLCLVTQGTGDTNRIGRKIFPTAVGIKGRLSYTPATTGIASDFVRIIVFADKQCNGATATVTDLLQSANYNSYRNLDNLERFDFLHDHVYSLQITAGTPTATSSVVHTPLNLYLDLASKNYQINYDASAGAITDLTSLNIGVMAIGLIDGTSTLDYISRLRFTD